MWEVKKLLFFSNADRIKPNISYGRIDHTTEFIVAPNLYKGINNSNALTNGHTDRTNGTTNETTATNKLLRSKTTAGMRRPSSMVVEEEDTNLSRSTTVSSMKKLTRSESVAKIKRADKMERLLKDLKRENMRSFEFRVVTGAWQEKAQISDVYVTKANLPDFLEVNALYCMKTVEEQEYYVKVKLMGEGDMPQNIHGSIELNANLMKLLNVKELEKVVLKPKAMVVNFVEKIELFANKKTHYKIIENAFKRYVIEKTNMAPMLLNQDEVVRLEEDLIVSVGILPEHFRYCLIDAQFLKESKIYAADLVRKVDDVLDVKPKDDTPLSVKDLIKLPEFDVIVDQLVGELKMNLCLDTKNAVLRQGNVLIAGE